MDTTKDYDFLISKNAKMQVLINLVINGLVVFLAMGKFLYVPIFEVGGFVQDVLVTNMFLIFFLFVFGKMEMEKWRKNNGKQGVWFDAVKHKKIEKYLTHGLVKNFFSLYLKYTLTYGLVTIALCVIAYGDMAGIPILHFMFIKLLYVCFLANSVATLAGRIGSIEMKSVAA